MSRAKGNLAEDKASLYLENIGFLIIDRNFYSRFGEIDIIVSKDNILHFVEVKSGLDYESAILNITKSKLNKIIRTAQVYMKKNSFFNYHLYIIYIIFIYVLLNHLNKPLITWK